MSTNKASCRNTTSPLWHLELLSNRVFSHTFRPWEFAFHPSRQHSRETERVKDRELCSSERESEIWAAALSCNKISKISLHHKDSPSGPAIFIWVQSHTHHTALLSCNPNFCQVLPQTSSLHPVCQQVWVHTINLDWESGRGDGGGEFTGGGRGGKVGQRT